MFSLFICILDTELDFVLLPLSQLPPSVSKANYVLYAWVAANKRLLFMADSLVKILVGWENIKISLNYWRWKINQSAPNCRDPSLEALASPVICRKLPPGVFRDLPETATRRLPWFTGNCHQASLVISSENHAPRGLKFPCSNFSLWK